MSFRAVTRADTPHVGVLSVAAGRSIHCMQTFGGVLASKMLQTGVDLRLGRLPTEVFDTDLAVRGLTTFAQEGQHAVRQSITCASAA